MVGTEAVPSGSLDSGTCSSGPSTGTRGRGAQPCPGAGISPAAAPSPLPPTESKQQAPLLCSGALSPGEPENHLGGGPWLGVLPSSQMPADRPARRSEHRAFRAPRCCEPGAQAGAQAGVCPQLQLPTGASRRRCRRQPPRVTAEGRASVESASQEPVAQEAVGCDLGGAVFEQNCPWFALVVTVCL